MDQVQKHLTLMSGATMYTCVVWAVNCQIAIPINCFTAQAPLPSGIYFWSLMTIANTVSTTAYRDLVEACAPSVLYWFVTHLVVICTLLPYFYYTQFKPT